MTAPGTERAELLKDNQVLSHNSSQHTTFKQSKGSDNQVITYTDGGC